MQSIIRIVVCNLACSITAAYHWYAATYSLSEWTTADNNLSRIQLALYDSDLSLLKADAKNGLARDSNSRPVDPTARVQPTKPQYTYIAALTSSNSGQIRERRSHPLSINISVARCNFSVHVGIFLEPIKLDGMKLRFKYSRPNEKMIKWRHRKRR